jgi:exosortase A
MALKNSFQFKNIIEIEKTRALLFLSAGLFLLVFYPVWVDLVDAWASSDDYSHGFLIIPISLYVLWRKREDLESAGMKPSWAFFPLVLSTLFFYLVSQYAEIVTLAPLAMILFLGASLLFLCGWQVFKLCIFSLFLLFFMVPVPAQIYASLTIPLQLFVTKVTVLVVSVLGVPILREGNVLFLPEHRLQVVQACSGLRSIMSLLTLGAVMGYFFLKLNFSRALLFVSAIPIAISVNIVRVFLIVVAFYYFNFDLAHGNIHTVFGALIFGFAIVQFFIFQKVLVLCEKFVFFRLLPWLSVFA